VTIGLLVTLSKIVGIFLHTPNLPWPKLMKKKLAIFSSFLLAIVELRNLFFATFSSLPLTSPNPKNKKTYNLFFSFFSHH
jgi:hypothetical protein